MVKRVRMVMNGIQSISKVNWIMAEFCKDCAKEVGMPFDGYPVFCEECGIYIEHSPFK